MPDTHFLDDRKAVSKLDSDNMLGSIEQLGNQVKQIWEDAQSIKVDPSYSKVKSVVVAGMGGSALGTHIIQTVFKDELKIPVIISPDYTVPNFVDENTLVVASSYSGSTEETLAAVADAHKKGAKITGITSGGKLAEFLKEHNYPALVFEPKYNPCNSPRMALGYSIFGQIVLLSKMGILKVEKTEYKAVLEAIAKAHLLSGIDIAKEKNPAKLLAFEAIDRIPVVMVSEHIEGAGHVFANQLNENAKTYSEYRVVPELNHHLMEGLKFPAGNDSTLLYVPIHSDLYQENNKLRMKLTEEVLEKHSIEHRILELKSATKLEQAFESLVFGSYTSFYISLLHDLNPTPIPWVDWFKEQLKNKPKS